MSNSQAATMGNAAARSFSAKKIAPYLFVAPFLLLFIAFIVAPLVYAVPVQLIAYHTAVFMGTDVDQPRNLAKSVTVE